MKLLVTGGTGFIGSHLAESALENGIKVNVLGLTDSDSDRQNADRLAALGAEIYAGPISDSALCQAALADVTHVQHLAVAMREAGVSEDYYRQVNLDGTRTLLDACHRAGVRRFIYCGTIGIFGHRFDGIADEDTRTRPGNIYEETKLAAETLAIEYGREIGIETLSLRPADVYGPRDRRLQKLFEGVANGRFPLFGNGSGRRHMIYVSDVVAAFEKSLIADGVVGDALIVAGPDVCTLSEMIDRIRIAAGRRRFGIRLPLRPMQIAAAWTEDSCAALGITPPIYRRRMDFFTSDVAFDTTRARQALGWQPQVDLDTGIAKTLAYYLSQIHHGG